MRYTSFALAVACLLLGALVTQLLAQAATPNVQPPQRWESKLVSLSDLTEPDQEGGEEIAAVEEEFNKLGQQGWRLTQNLFRAVVFTRPAP